MLVQHDITSEEWREYEFAYDGFTAVYRIPSPQLLVIRTGGTTHRIVDLDGVTHCVPAPGHFCCVVRWKASPPVEF